MQIKVKYHNEYSLPIKQAHGGEWCDLRVAEDIYMKAGEYKLIPLGVSIELPPGHEAIMAPRSSTFKNYGILQTNGIGIFDESFNSDENQWLFAAYATRDTYIPADVRIAQFRIQKNQGNLEIIKVESLNNEGRGGLGSTGTV